MTAIDRSTHTRPAHRTTTLRRIYDVWTQRQALKNLDAAALEDIGISARDAQAEAAKPLWDVPKTWRC